MRPISKHITTVSVFVAILTMLCSCRTSRQPAAQVEGHYQYQHGWSYDVPEGHITVHETGTLDFHHDGSGLDSARQVYVMTLNDGGKITWVFDYINHSRWRLEGEDFYFVGVPELFRMEVTETVLEDCDPHRADKLAQGITKFVHTGIAQEVKFHLAKLTKRKMMWTYTYPDGHTDTWTFYRHFF